MKLHATAPGANQAVTGYGENFVAINGQRYESSLIVLPDRIVPWEVASFDSLAEPHFQVFLDLDLEILLVGTGPKQRFPHPRLTRALLEKRIGLEAMDLQAACRTYNILMAEGRRVAAALLFK